MNLDLLTKSILKLSLSPNQNQLMSLRGEVLDMPEFYLVAAEGTAQSDWESGEYKCFIDRGKTLISFLSSVEAAAFATRQGCKLSSGDFPIVCKDNDAFARLIAEYESQQMIDCVKIYARTPIHLEFSPADFRRGGLDDSSSFDENNAEASNVHNGSPVSVPDRPQMSSRTFKGVDEVRRALETYEANARRKIDPGARYENIHTLIQTLAQQNESDPTDMDKILGLTDGYSRRFFISVTEINPPIGVMQKYLSYFGLEGYLYIYKSDSRELARYLGSHKIIDKFALRSSPSPSAERFRLESITQGTDKETNAYIYKLSLTSNKGNHIEIVVSNPMKPAPLIVGREYQLMNRGGKVREVDEAPQKITGVSSLPGEEEMAALVASLEEKGNGKKSGRDKPARTYEETRKDEIIKYFREKGLDTRSATAKYRDLEIEDDILDEFYKYVTKKQFGKLELFGYSARKLIKEMHMEPYEAFLSMVQLRSNPQETKQRLIYRERDPQYQKKPKKRGEDAS